MENDEYEAYVRLCEASNLRPIEQRDQLTFLQAVSALDPHLIPYMTLNGTIWVHDTRHKTKRRDRPFFAMNMEAMKEK